MWLNVSSSRSGRASWLVEPPAGGHDDWSARNTWRLSLSPSESSRHRRMRRWALGGESTVTPRIYSDLAHLHVVSIDD
jgi:hypothetical protein